MNKSEEAKESLYLELKRIRAEAKKEYNPKNISFDPDKLQKRISRSEHLVDFNDIQLDKGWLEKYFKEFILSLKKFTKENGSFIEKYEDSFERDKLDLEILTKKVFIGDSDYLKNLASELGVEDKDLFFIGLELGRPVFELYAEKLKGKVQPDNWGKGNCPVCGSNPAMAYLREDDGKRILWCQFCGTEWSFMRIKCPFCSNDDHDTLRYFFTDEKSPYRVDVCDKCIKYIKTVDQRKIEEGVDLDLYWESIKTYPMDLVAQKEGFSNPQTSGKRKGAII